MLRIKLREDEVRIVSPEYGVAIVEIDAPIAQLSTHFTETVTKALKDEGLSERVATEVYDNMVDQIYQASAMEYLRERLV